MQRLSVKTLFIVGLIISAQPIKPCCVDDEYLSYLGKRDLQKPPSPLLNAAKAGRITPLEELLLGAKADPHERDAHGVLVCVQACKQAHLPRQVSVKALFLLHGHGGCGDCDGILAAESPIAQGAQKKIKEYITAGLRGQMPDAVLMLVVHYFAPSAKKKKLILSPRSLPESLSESSVEESQE